MNHHPDRTGEPDEFEQALTRAMQRVELRSQTAARLLAIAAEAEAERRRTGRRWFRPRTGGLLFLLPRSNAWTAGWLGGAVVAALLAGVFVAQDVHRRQERARADRQFALSMQIEERALEHTRQQLARAGFPLGD